MLDKVGLQIPFSSNWVECNVSDIEKNVPNPFTRDFTASVLAKYIPVTAGAKSIFWNVENGTWDFEELYIPWESISSGHSGLAIKVYHEGNGFCKWPYIELKGSPAKIVQGHNVFGFDDLRFSVSNMLWLLNQKYPEFLGGHDVLDHLGPMLDLDNARVSELDITYSLRIPEEKIRLAVIDFISSTSKGHTKPSGECYKSTAYFGAKRSRQKGLKVYDKRLETLFDNKERKRKKLPLIGKDILELADGLLRFEATGKREWFERRMIPTNMYKMIEYFENNEGQYRAIFNELMKDLFASFEGQRVEIMNDDKIYKQIEKECGTTRGKAARVFGTYQAIKAIGLDRFKQQYLDDNKKPTKTYYRLLSELCSCGFSKAAICNLHKPSNIIIKLPTIVHLGALFEPCANDHVFVSLWDQVTAA